LSALSARGPANAGLRPSRLLLELLTSQGLLDASQLNVTWELLNVTWEALNVTWESVSWEGVTWENVTWADSTSGSVETAAEGAR
ncbi:MAG: hypothetical protein ACRDGE_01585, partial [Candidatus Limnocylindria bacterium]